MEAKVEGRPKIDVAKEVLGTLVGDLPADTRVGLVAYGHTRKDDCKDVQVLTPLSEGGPDAIRKALASVRPKGKTPLAYALQDSPTGWLAWVTQLFGDAVEADYIITNAAAYWLTGTIGSSIRRYWEDAHTTAPPREPTTTPTGVAIFAQDFQSIRKFAARDHANIVSWRRYPTGSHFAAQDAPDLLIADIRTFFRALR